MDNLYEQDTQSPNSELVMDDAQDFEEDKGTTSRAQRPYRTAPVPATYADIKKIPPPAPTTLKPIRYAEREETTSAPIQRGQRRLEALRASFRQQGEVFLEGKESIRTAELPEKPDFPYAITIVAAVKDISDAILTTTILGAVFTSVTSFFLSLIIAVWVFERFGREYWKSRLLWWAAGRYIAVFFFELIPFLNFIPTNVIFIFMVHLREKKLTTLRTEELQKLVNTETFA